MCMHGVLNRQGLHVHPGICHQTPLSDKGSLIAYGEVLYSPSLLLEGWSSLKPQTSHAGES